MTTDDTRSIAGLLIQNLSNEGEDSTPAFEVETDFDPTVETSNPAETGFTPDDDTDFDPTATSTEVSPATHRVKVDGEEIEVSYDELVNGYSRQAHFTKQQQALRQRERELQEADALVAALSRDPQSTLRYLAQAYGIQFGQPQPMPQATPRNQPTDFWDTEDVDTTGGVPDPAQQAMWARLQELEAFAAQTVAQQRQSAADRQLADLHDRYGDFEDEAIYAHAVKYGIPDLGQAYASWAFQEQQAAQAATREASDRQVRESKRKAGVVSSGNSRQAGTDSEPPPPKDADFKTVAMWALKKAGLA